MTDKDKWEMLSVNSKKQTKTCHFDVDLKFGRSLIINSRQTIDMPETTQIPEEKLFQFWKKILK